jgi:hypothetical protein
VSANGVVYKLARIPAERLSHRPRAFSQPIKGNGPFRVWLGVSFKTDDIRAQEAQAVADAQREWDASSVVTDVTPCQTTENSLIRPICQAAVTRVTADDGDAWSVHDGKAT